MNKSREAQINKRLQNIPRSLQSIYRRATSGNSLRAAVNAFCVECVGYVTNEVRQCTDRGCPLWAVRPYQDSSQSAREGRDIAAKSKISAGVD